MEHGEIAQMHKVQMRTGRGQVSEVEKEEQKKRGLACMKNSEWTPSSLYRSERNQKDRWEHVEQ